MRTRRLEGVIGIRVFLDHTFDLAHPPPPLLSRRFFFFSSLIPHTHVLHVFAQCCLSGEIILAHESARGAYNDEAKREAAQYCDGTHGDIVYDLLEYVSQAHHNCLRAHFLFFVHCVYSSKGVALHCPLCRLEMTSFDIFETKENKLVKSLVEKCRGHRKLNAREESKLQYWKSEKLKYLKKKKK